MLKKVKVPLFLKKLVMQLFLYPLVWNISGDMQYILNQRDVIWQFIKSLIDFLK